MAAGVAPAASRFPSAGAAGFASELFGGVGESAQLGCQQTTKIKLHASQEAQAARRHCDVFAIASGLPLHQQFAESNDWPAGGTPAGPRFPSGRAACPTTEDGTPRAGRPTCLFLRPASYRGLADRSRCLSSLLKS